MHKYEHIVCNKDINLYSTERLGEHNDPNTWDSIKCQTPCKSYHWGLGNLWNQISQLDKNNQNNRDTPLCVGKNIRCLFWQFNQLQINCNLSIFQVTIFPWKQHYHISIFRLGCCPCPIRWGWLSDVITATKIWVNIASGNGLLPHGTKLIHILDMSLKINNLILKLQLQRDNALGIIKH